MQKEVKMNKIFEKYKTIGEVVDLPIHTFKDEVKDMSLGDKSTLRFMLSQEYQRSIIVQTDLTNKMQSTDSDTEFNSFKDISMSLYAKMQSIEDKNKYLNEEINKEQS